MQVRTPFHQLPITLVNKAIKQKAYRRAYCVECGWPLCEITDKIVMVSDGEVDLSQLPPDKIGIVDIHCSNHRCKQYFRMDFSN